MKILDFNLFNLLEGKKTELEFIKQPKKVGAKTETYKVIKAEIEIGVIKWSSRLRGYGFLPSVDCQDEIKDFIKDLMKKRRKRK